MSLEYSLTFSIKKRVMLTGVLRQLLINHIKKNFNTIFIENVKKMSEKLIISLFSYKKFLNIIPKVMPGHSLTYFFKKKKKKTIKSLKQTELIDWYFPQYIYIYIYGRGGFLLSS